MKEVIKCEVEIEVSSRPNCKFIPPGIIACFPTRWKWRKLTRRNSNGYK